MDAPTPLVSSPLLVCLVLVGIQSEMEIQEQRHAIHLWLQRTSASLVTAYRSGACLLLSLSFSLSSAYRYDSGSTLARLLFRPGVVLFWQPKSFA